jgi:hypothetical protein
MAMEVEEPLQVAEAVRQKRGHPRLCDHQYYKHQQKHHLLVPVTTLSESVYPLPTT